MQVGACVRGLTCGVGYSLIDSDGDTGASVGGRAACVFVVFSCVDNDDVCCHIEHILAVVLLKAPGSGCPRRASDADCACS